MSDVIIIGGGVAGLSAAARLAPHASVTLLEAEDQLGYHTSGRSAAMYEENYGARATVALNRASRTYLMDHDGGYLSLRGFLLVGSAGNKAAFAEDFATLGMDEISPAEAQVLVPVLNPVTTTQFGYHADAWDIDTDRMLQAYAATARGSGAEIVTKARVEAIGRNGANWRVITTAGDFIAPLIVNAAGAWADGIAQLAAVAPLGITPMRRSVARVAAPDGHDVSTWPMLFGPGETWYAKPDAGALIISPADEDPTTPHDAWADDMVLAEGIARYEGVVTTPVTRMLSNWAGLRSFAPDRNLVIGFDAHVPGFFWLAGQGGYGMQSSPATSQLAADLILGRGSEIDDAARAALDPMRFG